MLNHLLINLEAELATAQQIAPLFKSALVKAKEDLAKRFEDGETADALIPAHSDFMDGIMRIAWQRFNWPENLRSWRKSRISLIAVGGYGRRELLPHSDIDLLILLERDSHNTHRANIQSFTTLLWDIGLEVGHSVRSLSECKTQATHNVTVLTAMMESRTIIGDDELLVKMQQKISPKKVWPAKDFYLAKKLEQFDRHEKSDHTEYSLEPNIKSSPGGLRDIQTLIWVALRHYGAQTIEELAVKEILTTAETEELIKARSHLWKIRFGLHLLAGKDENRLLFGHQQQLAANFGYEDGNQLAVEQFMQSYYRIAHQVNAINDILLQHFEEVIVQVSTRLMVKPVNDQFQLVNNQLEAKSENIFVDTPSALLDMFAIVGADETIAGFRASTIRLARRHVHLIKDGFRADPKNAALFMQILGSKNHLFTQLRRMGRWGVLGAYLPEFGRVIGQMQFDLFHIYTVDAHTLQVVRNMRRFRYKNNEQKFPIAAHIHPRLPKIELLYIAGLYHDIAKGMGGDHSQLGISIARDFCERHGLSNWETNIVCWLVENHLVMSTTAQRKDIQDPEIIFEFAQFVGDQVRLDYLYALTVADINATNPTLWNGWRAALMRQLYSETKKALRAGLENHVDRQDYIIDVQNKAIEKLEEHQRNREDIVELWNEVDEDYFVRERVIDIVWHTEAIIDQRKNDSKDSRPVILIQDDRSRASDTGFTQIFVHTTDRPDLFGSIVSAIAKLDLNIMDARIATSATNLTFNTFTVLESNGLPVGEKASRVEKIRKTIEKFLKTDDISLARTKRTSRILKHFKQKTHVEFTQDPHLPLTVLEVVTPDRPGLLSIIADIFIELDINLASARITTLGERVEDLFYITGPDGQPIKDEETMNALRSKICDALDQYVEKIAG